MICTSVVPCLSSGLAKCNKIMSYFSSFFRHFGIFSFFENGRGGGGTNLTQKQPNGVFLVNFSKVQQLSNNFSKNAAILTKN